MNNIKYRLGEIIILSIYLATIIIPIKYFPLTQDMIILISSALFCATLSILEHKKQLIFNRDTNKFTIVEKALFINEYKINKQLPLDDITGATIKKRIITGKKRKKTYQYQVLINSKTEENIDPFNLTFSNKEYATENMNKINNFLEGCDSSLVLTDAPYLVRLMGILVYCISYVHYIQLYM